MKKQLLVANLIFVSICVRHQKVQLEYQLNMAIKIAKRKRKNNRHKIFSSSSSKRTQKLLFKQSKKTI
jgi:flagellar biogenesis protein FliO